MNEQENLVGRRLSHYLVERRIATRGLARVTRTPRPLSAAAVRFPPRSRYFE